MKWIFWGIWCILCTIGMIFNMLFFCFIWFVKQLWEFHYVEYTWNNHTEDEVFDCIDSGTYFYSWKSEDITPWDTYKRWINFDI